MGVRLERARRALTVGRVAHRSGLRRFLAEVGLKGRREATREGAEAFRRLEELGTTSGARVGADPRREGQAGARTRAGTCCHARPRVLPCLRVPGGRRGRLPRRSAPGEPPPDGRRSARAARLRPARPARRGHPDRPGPSAARRRPEPGRRRGRSRRLPLTDLYPARISPGSCKTCVANWRASITGLSPPSKPGRPWRICSGPPSAATSGCRPHLCSSARRSLRPTRSRVSPTRSSTRSR